MSRFSSGRAGGGSPAPRSQKLARAVAVFVVVVAVLAALAPRAQHKTADARALRELARERPCAGRIASAVLTSDLGDNGIGGETYRVRCVDGLVLDVSL